MAPQEYSVIGKRVPRIDSVEKATGAAQYLADLKIPGMLYGKILRSSYPHAKILAVDTSKAERLPGVRAVVTGRDTSGIRLCFVLPHMANKPPLAEDKVRFVGDEIAAVAADDEHVAEEALDLIHVEYEELPAVFDPLEAMKPETIKIHEGGNVALRGSRSFGDVETAFRRSDYVLEDRFETQAQPHCCLEPNGCIAYLDQSGRLTLWATTQWVHILRQMLAYYLAMPINKIRVIQGYMGAGFGGRLDVDSIHVVAYFLSKKTRRPVLIVNTHDEQFTSGRYRYPMIIDIKTGLKKDGTILARDVNVVTDQGAYNGFSIPITMGIGTKCTYLWGVPNVKFEAYVVFTNKVFGGAFRGFGNPQITFAIESQMDMIADKLGMDMRDLCLKNVNYEGQVTCMDHKITSCGLKESIEKATEAAGWNKKRRRPGNRGLGMASFMHVGSGLRGLYGDCNASDAFIKMNNDGTIDLSSGAAEIGQGSDTVLAQIAAEELGIRVEDINVITGDTSTTPYCLGAWGSREVFIAGNAVKMAAREIKPLLLEEACRILEARLEDLVARNGKVFVADSPENSVHIEELVRAYYNRGVILAGRGCYDDPAEPRYDPETRYPIGGAAAYGFGTHVVEVEVDRETGKVKVLKVVAAHDLGKAINPMMAEGQIEGGVLQGLGYALSESLVWEEGIILNPNFQDYRILYIHDVPPIKPIFIETSDPEGPFGAKGLGEHVKIPVAAAVANAIYHAVGIRIKSLPITPEKILNALKEKD